MQDGIPQHDVPGFRRKRAHREENSGDPEHRPQHDARKVLNAAREHRPGADEHPESATQGTCESEPDEDPQDAVDRESAGDQAVRDHQDEEHARERCQLERRPRDDEFEWPNLGVVQQGFVGGDGRRTSVHAGAKDLIRDHASGQETDDVRAFRRLPIGQREHGVEGQDEQRRLDDRPQIPNLVLAEASPRLPQDESFDDAGLRADARREAHGDASTPSEPGSPPEATLRPLAPAGARGTSTCVGKITGTKNHSDSPPAPAPAQASRCSASAAVPRSTRRQRRPLAES